MYFDNCIGDLICDFNSDCIERRGGVAVEVEG
jgi:hypothetical protein